MTLLGWATSRAALHATENDGKKRGSPTWDHLFLVPKFLQTDSTFSTADVILSELTAGAEELL